MISYYDIFYVGLETVIILKKRNSL